MKFLLGLGVFLLMGVGTVSAYQLVVTEVEKPYDVVPLVGDVFEPQAYLGELDNFPLMYEVSSEEPFTFEAKVSQRYMSAADPVPFSIIIIRQDDSGGGVTEVTRLRPTAEEWTSRKDRVYGMTFWETEAVSVEVEEGIYRIEVSTPENIGKYQLAFGSDDVNTGFFETLGNVRTTQKFFGYSIMNMLLSSYVYYPLGVLLLLFIIQRTWKYRKTIAHVG